MGDVSELFVDVGTPASHPLSTRSANQVAYSQTLGLQDKEDNEMVLASDDLENYFDSFSGLQSIATLCHKMRLRGTTTHRRCIGSGLLTRLNMLD